MGKGLLIGASWFALCPSPPKKIALSQAVGAFGVRHCRYIGLAKTHLQHIATAAAINLSRLFDWLRTVPRSQTRQSRFAALKPLPQDSPSTQAWECGA
jgi:hypothetical protein